MPKYQYIVENNDLSTPGSFIITLKPKKNKDNFVFEPGQYAMLSFYDSAGKLFINHPFSIASSPTRIGRLRFGIKILGKFTQNLSRIMPGTEVSVFGPFGNFTFDEDIHKEPVFIAGGVGITPFISASEYAADKKLANPITLLYGVRTLKDALFYEEIKNLTDINPNFKAKLKVTQETVDTSSIYCENGYINQETILESVGSVAGKDFFICGPSAFMKAMASNLIALHVPVRNIHKEAFSVTPDLTFKQNAKSIFLVSGVTAALFILFLTFVNPSVLASDEDERPVVADSATDSGQIVTTTKQIAPAKKVKTRATVNTPTTVTNANQLTQTSSQPVYTQVPTPRTAVS